MIIALFILAGLIHPHLAAKLNNLADNKKIAVIVHMKRQPTLLNLSYLCKEEKIAYLKEFCRKDQADLLKFLAQQRDVAHIKSYWLFNGLSFTATKKVILEMIRRDDIDYIIDDFSIQIQVPEKVSSREPEWNIQKIIVDSCWNIGFDGTGVIVGTMDTGVDIFHPALQGKWAGAWYDAVNNQPDPYDDHGHGTFVMGIICGGDGLGPFVDDIGVAPGARFIAAKAFDSNGSGQFSWIHDAFQWFAGQDVDLINNSWGSTNQTSLEFWNDCMNLRSLGIIPTFAIGSSGPSPGSTCTPGNFPIVIGSGSTDLNDDIAAFSSRGPAPNQPPWNDSTYWSRPDWNLTKPDISAPGVAIRSCVPGGGYQTWTGTSMSIAHISGALLILLQADSLSGYRHLYKILLDYADHPPQGEPYPNNDYGWGRVNVWKALQALLGIQEKTEEKYRAKITVSPNPFSSTTRIKFESEDIESVSLKIYDKLGRLIKKTGLVQGPYFIWDGTDTKGNKVCAGVYFIQAQVQGLNKIEKVIRIY